MKSLEANRSTEGRFSSVSEQKSDGATYTPKLLADFVAKSIVETAQSNSMRGPVRVLDPAVGDGELLISLLRALPKKFHANVEVHGYETNASALSTAESRILAEFPTIRLMLKLGDFIDSVTAKRGRDLFQDDGQVKFDLMIANPPYVRTQILGAKQSKKISEKFGLKGRLDLYHAFILGMSELLKPTGTAGIIVSNRFMTTQSGACVRKAVLTRFHARHIWDLGDTKLFNAAVLPAVLLLQGRHGQESAASAFSAIYETADDAEAVAKDPIDALGNSGVIALPDGRRFSVQHGKLDTDDSIDGVWRLATEEADEWLETVKANTWGTFRDIGRIRVGVKTTADKVFIRDDWDEHLEGGLPELLLPLTTHHVAGRFRAKKPKRARHILYTHEVVDGKRRAIDVSKYANANSYLQKHRKQLEGRKYVIEAGRNWYEIWVPQDPSAWAHTKLVFRDISAEPTFWIDKSGSVVNGDCYWMINESTESDDLLWLAAAVANSKFIEAFYDHRFRNKLYAGRRRFITQYVEKFPIPDPELPEAREIVAIAKQIFSAANEVTAAQMREDLDGLIWGVFGLSVEEVAR